MPLWGDVLLSAGYRPFDLQVERLIAVSRVALITFALLALALDPTDRSQNWQIALVVLLCYAGVATLAAALELSPLARATWRVPLHMLDIGMVSALMYLSDGPTSPFFAFYMFILLAATLRWNWQGALWTGGCLVVLLVALSFADADDFFSGEDNQLADVIIRATFLLIASGMLAGFGLSLARTRKLLARISAWPSPPQNASGTDACSDLAPALAHVAQAMQVPRIVVIWQRSDGDRLEALSWSSDACEHDRSFEGFIDSTIAPEVRRSTFFSPDISFKTCVSAAGMQTCRTALIAPELAARFTMHSVASARFGGVICSGRVFLLDRARWRDDDLVAAEIVAARIGIELEHYTLRLQLEESLAMRERARLARDLHDGLLQTLTAAGLQLKAALSRDGHFSRDFLENLRILLADEQRRVRTFITARPDDGVALLPDATLASVLAQMKARLEMLWDCSIDVTIASKEARISRRLARQLDFLLAESVANAVHHGRASRIGVTAETFADRLVLEVSDNGSGLGGVKQARRGANVVTLSADPVSLRSRITELNGILTVSSAATGTTLLIELPLQAAS